MYYTIFIRRLIMKIENVVEIELPVDEKFTIKKNRIMN